MERKFPKGRAPVFGFIGRAEDPSKGFWVLEKAAKVIQGINPNIEFIFIGAKETKIKDNARYLPFVDRKRLEEFYAMFDVLVIPSFEEGLPLVLLEGMARGLPIITTPVGGIIEVLYCGDLFAPGDFWGLSRAILYRVENGAETLEMGRLNREKAYAEFGLDKMLAGIEAIYEECGKKSIRVHIHYKLTKRPSGGANSFLTSLSRWLGKQNDVEMVDSMEDCDILLLNSWSSGPSKFIDVDKIRRIREMEKRPIIVHRLDGIRSLYGTKDEKSDKVLFDVMELADCYVFQSDFSLQQFKEHEEVKKRGMDLSKALVIHNGVNQDIFHP